MYVYIICNTHGHRCDTHGYRCLFVLLLMLLVQLNCGLQFLENKILFVSLASAINLTYVTIFLSNLTHQLIPEQTPPPETLQTMVNF